MNARADTTSHARSSDGARIAYVTRGTGRPALVFVHGGLANRTFWREQIEGLSPRYQVVAVDLAGHGESERRRAASTIARFGEDVCAVVNHLGLSRLVIIGNSLGGPAALEAAALLPERAMGVVGVDTFHDATVRQPPEEVRARAAAFARDPAGSCRAMVGQLFHPNAYGSLRGWAETEMCAVPPDVVVPMLEGFAGYDLAAAFRKAGVPIRAINGDLWPTQTDRNRSVVADFDAVVIPHAGHYPMLEQPEVFNRLLERLVEELDHRGQLER